MAEFSDDMLVEFALGLRDDRDIQEAVKTSPELRARLRDLECELRGLDEGLEELLAGAPSQSALPSSGWQILLAIDDSPGAKRAAATAGVLAGLADAEVEVLHVREVAQGRMDPPVRESRHEALALVGDVVSGLLDVGVTALGEIQAAPVEQVAARILAEAETRQVSLIVMSSRTLPAVMAFLCGSVSRRVLRKAKCPVLIVR
jgi:nucleotide-binding universal stress UspA family protein